ncbi:MAG: aromatic ring-hydroxylating dioxygenase subunit alpha [Gammaproteobacteria bacterium]|nr:aromatic ring-hydroxylating dioxygenase subunit alpha [Gammaproteobacteria bacterium]MDH3858222.1 aromatic ring-hydroxylating dioxygenase subunit alpha [Gammaproteobacteria bacterium]
MTVEPNLVSREALLKQLSAVLPDENHSLGIPPACYADAGLLALEQDAVFHHGWIGLGRADRWPNAGDYSAMDIGGVPLIVLRNQSGALKAFANSCRHRGSQMLNGDGNCKKIKCPFHWWTYDLDGRLKVYPRMETAVDFDPGEFGLVEFTVAVEQGFAFISFEDHPASIVEWLGNFGEFHQSWGVGHWKMTRIREFEVQCNWKTFIEVFNEYYHLPMVHPDSINWLYPEPDSVDTVKGQYTTQFGTTEGAAALMEDSQQYALPNARGLKGREAKGTRYTWIYPNLTFALSQDSMWIYQAFPVSADCCRVIQTICFPAESVALDDFSERAVHYYQRIDAALDEDLPFLEQQQVGLNSKFARQGRFSALEPSVGKFAYWYAQQLLKCFNPS